MENEPDKGRKRYTYRGRADRTQGAGTRVSTVNAAQGHGGRGRAGRGLDLGAGLGGAPAPVRPRMRSVGAVRAQRRPGTFSRLLRGGRIRVWAP